MTSNCKMMDNVNETHDNGRVKGVFDSAIEDRDDSTEKEENSSSPTFKDQELDLEVMMLSCKTTESKGDINLFEDMFQSWKNQEKRSEALGKDLEQKLEIYEKDKEVAERKVVDLEKSVDLLQKAIESLHNDLELTDKLGKENVDLKASVKDLEEKLANHKEESEEKYKNFEKQISEDKSIHENQLKELQLEMSIKLKDKDKIINDYLTEKEEELNKLSREKESEKQKLTVEYENKLVKLQRQKASASINQQQSSSANQEIFRKKLQHLKKEHEAEIRSMRMQIQSLQDQMNAAKSVQNKPSISTQPLFKRARRY